MPAGTGYGRGKLGPNKGNKPGRRKNSDAWSTAPLRDKKRNTGLAGLDNLLKTKKQRVAEGKMSIANQAMADAARLKERERSKKKTGKGLSSKSTPISKGRK